MAEIVTEKEYLIEFDLREFRLLNSENIGVSSNKLFGRYIVKDGGDVETGVQIGLNKPNKEANLVLLGATLDIENLNNDDNGMKASVIVAE